VEEEEEDTFEVIMYRILERLCPFTDMVTWKNMASKVL